MEKSDNDLPRHDIQALLSKCELCFCYLLDVANEHLSLNYFSFFHLVYDQLLLNTSLDILEKVVVEEGKLIQLNTPFIETKYYDIPSINKLVNEYESTYITFCIRLLKPLISIHNCECQTYGNLILVHYHLRKLRYMDSVIRVQKCFEAFTALRNVPLLALALENASHKNLSSATLVDTHHDANNNTNNHQMSLNWFGWIPNFLTKIIPSPFSASAITTGYNPSSCNRNNQQINNLSASPPLNYSRSSTKRRAKRQLVRLNLIDTLGEHIIKLRNQIAFYFLTKQPAMLLTPFPSLVKSNQTTTFELKERFKRLVESKVASTVALVIEDLEQAQEGLSHTLNIQSDDGEGDDVFTEEAIYGIVKKHMICPFFEVKRTAKSDPDTHLPLKHGITSRYIIHTSYPDEGNTTIKHLMPSFVMFLQRDKPTVEIFNPKLNVVGEKIVECSRLKQVPGSEIGPLHKVLTSTFSRRTQLEKDHFPNSSYPLTKPNLVEYLLSKTASSHPLRKLSGYYQHQKLDSSNFHETATLGIEAIQAEGNSHTYHAGQRVEEAISAVHHNYHHNLKTSDLPVSPTLSSTNNRAIKKPNLSQIFTQYFNANEETKDSKNSYTPPLNRNEVDPPENSLNILILKQPSIFRCRDILNEYLEHFEVDKISKASFMLPSINLRTRCFYDKILNMTLLVTNITVNVYVFMAVPGSLLKTSLDDKVNYPESRDLSSSPLPPSLTGNIKDSNTKKLDAPVPLETDCSKMGETEQIIICDDLQEQQNRRQYQLSTSLNEFFVYLNHTLNLPFQLIQDILPI